MEYIHFILGLTGLLILAYITSSNKKIIKFRYVFQLLIIQIILAYIMINSTQGLLVVNSIADVFEKLLTYANQGTEFVFGGLTNQGEFSFFLKVLMPIVFISALIGILQYIKILNIVINALGWLISKISGMGKLESFNAVNALMLGQQESFITYKNMLQKMSPKRLYSLSAIGMSTVSMAIVGSYMSLIEPKYVVTALVLNMVGVFIILHLLNPYDDSKEVDLLEIQKNTTVEKQSFFEMLGEYILTGFKIAIIVAAMLIGFLALIAMINAIFTSVLGISFEDILGYAFTPIAWLLGISSDDMHSAGSIMATKIVTNEFVAMTKLREISQSLSSHTIGVVSIFLVSFANFSSIGILSGAVQGLHEESGKKIAKFGLRLLYGATLVSLLSALVAGIFIY